MTFDYKKITQARIALGHAGPGLPTKAWLLFSYHHACAVDAIHLAWDMSEAKDQITPCGLASVVLSTEARDRKTYLTRPDLGCKLADDSKEVLNQMGDAAQNSILIMASNGLSSRALLDHLSPFLRLLLPELSLSGFSVAYDSVFLVANGRVGLIDDLGERTKAELGLVLIGERPGLSSIDSLAAYLTFRPRTGRTNADRNCVSNIRPPHGLAYDEALSKVIYLIREAVSRKLSGTALKEQADPSLS